jgi:hypothetical protein
MSHKRPSRRGAELSLMNPGFLPGDTQEAAKWDDLAPTNQYSAKYQPFHWSTPVAADRMRSWL